MVRLSETVILKSVDENSIVAIQSMGDYDYREVFKAKNDGKVWSCVVGEKLFGILDESPIKVEHTPTTVTFFTSDGEYTLPVLRERGLLMSRPEVAIQGDPKKTWSYDYSGKSISTSSTGGTSLPSTLIALGPDVIARTINNVMEVYGDPDTTEVCICPEELALLQKLGEAKVSIYETGELLAKSSKGEVRIRKTKGNSGLFSAVVSKFSQRKELFEADLSGLKFKAFSKFILEKIVVIFKKDSVTFVTDSAKKVYEVPGLDLDKPLTVEMLSKDLKHLTGKLVMLDSGIDERNRYLFKVQDKEKTVYIGVITYGGEITW